MTAPITIVVVDDQSLMRTGFRMILDAEDDLAVVGEAADGQEGIDVVRSLRPDVVLMDIRMPVLDGIAATEQISALPDGARPAILVLTTFDLDEYVYAALRAGASGFLLKDAPPDDLVAAIRLVHAGQSMLAPSITRRLIDDFASRPDAKDNAAVDSARLAELTERELDVLRAMARGLSNTEIAEELFVGETTVKTHVGRIFMKLDVRDRVQAVVAAYEHGVVQPGS